MEQDSPRVLIEAVSRGGWAGRMFQMCGVFAEFERGMIRERVNAGLARAKVKGVCLGRRKLKASIEARIRELRTKGMGIRRSAGL